MKSRDNKCVAVVLFILFVWPLWIAPHAALGEEEVTLEQIEQSRTTLSAVGRLFQAILPNEDGMRIESVIRDLGTDLEEIRSIQAKPTASPTDKESLAAQYKQCHKALKRFSDTTLSLPGLVKVATQEERTNTFAITPGRSLLGVLWCKGDEKALPTLERILVDPGTSDTLTGTWTGAGHHFCFIEFNGLAMGEHRYRLEFKGTHSCSQSVVVRVIKSNTLKVQVTEGTAGTVIPCMITLTSLTDQTNKVPQEALDFDAHFDSGPQRRKLLRMRAPYWGELTTCCVEGTATFEVYPGKWRLSVAKGIEYTPWIEEFELGEDTNTEKTVTLKRWVDSASLGWYSGDGHVHTFQQTDEQHQRIMTWAKANDIHVVNTMKMGDINRTYFENAGFGKDFRYQNGDTVLVPGQECPRTDELGHTQALNLANAMVRDTDHYYLYDLMFDGAHAQGAITGYCHVGSQSFNVNRGMSLNIPRGEVDFLELLQFSQMDTDLWYDFLNLGFKAAVFAGSDVPWGGSIGEVRVYAYLGESGFDTDNWFKAVKNGRTFVSNGPMLDFKVNGALPGETIDLSMATNVSVQAKAWGDSTIGRPEILQVVVEGEVIHTATATDSTSPLEMSFDLPVTCGVWIAARAYATNGSVAHTTPIYVTVNGDGFVKKTELTSLLAKRKQSLQEIVDLVASEKVSNPTGPIAVQGEALLERVGIANNLYDKIKSATAGVELFNQY